MPLPRDEREVDDALPAGRGRLPSDDARPRSRSRPQDRRLPASWARVEVREVPSPDADVRVPGGVQGKGRKARVRADAHGEDRGPSPGHRAIRVLRAVGDMETALVVDSECAPASDSRVHEVEAPGTVGGPDAMTQLGDGTHPVARGEEGEVRR